MVPRPGVYPLVAGAQAAAAQPPPAIVSTVMSSSESSEGSSSSSSGGFLSSVRWRQLQAGRTGKRPRKARGASAAYSARRARAASAAAFSAHRARASSAGEDGASAGSGGGGDAGGEEESGEKARGWESGDPPPPPLSAAPGWAGGDEDGAASPRAAYSARGARAGPGGRELTPALDDSSPSPSAAQCSSRVEPFSGGRRPCVASASEGVCGCDQEAFTCSHGPGRPRPSANDACADNFNDTDSARAGGGQLYQSGGASTAHDDNDDGEPLPDAAAEHLLFAESLIADDGDVDVEMFRDAWRRRHARTRQLFDAVIASEERMAALLSELDALEAEVTTRGGHEWRIAHRQRRERPGGYVQWANRLDEDVFQDEFGISHAMCDAIVQRVRSDAAFRTRRRPHAVEHILLVTLLRGRTGLGVRHLRTSASTSAGAACEDMRTMHRVVVQAFWGEHVIALQPDTPAKRVAAAAAFKALRGVPDCVGICDGTGVPIPFPPIKNQSARESYRYYKSSKVRL